MRQLIRRLSRVGDCASSSSSPSSSMRRGESGRKKKAHAGVPEGHVPVYVGGEEEASERFVVRTEVLGAPAMAELLGRAAQEYGYRHQGPIRIPFPAAVFRRALASVAGDDDDDVVEDGE
ncbi:hypothetical protein HU200_060946 [Digitaria exilis]|uniref:Small auxin up regulated protein n=1 Tax=Digitaria exilis TaxID=1010633 RepID=A0A835AFS8_9POAL|nr:hypothetical protein HU200_060946 [Digitaria exilis]